MVLESWYGLDDYIIVEQVPSGISVSSLSAYQLLCLWEGCFGLYTCLYFGTTLICVSPKVVFYNYLLHLAFFFILSLQEQKIREGLYMMSLKDEIFHLSWFITYALQAGFSFLNFD